MESKSPTYIQNKLVIQIMKANETALDHPKNLRQSAMLESMTS